MFKNVIVGVDGREGGRDAIALAKVLRDEGGVITLAHVRPGESLVWRGSSPAYEAVEEGDSHDLLEHARGETGDGAFTCSHAAPSVGRGLHELADELGADLIVIGSSRRGVFGRVLVGDHTREALGGAPCAVAVAPVGYSRQPLALSEIGVGYDGSAESERAVGAARKLAETLGTRLSAFQAVFFPVHPYAGLAFPGPDAIEAMVDAAREQVAALGGVEAHAAYGLAAEELALYSASLDLLVIGSRGYGPLGRLVHGSTARMLAHTARCPLLVLTRRARRDGSNGPEGAVREKVTAGAAG